MPRDYKHRATRRKRRRKLSPWVGVVSGLLLGLFVAFLVFLKMQTPPEPPAFFQESLPPPAEEAVTEPAAENAAADSRETPQSPPPPPKPRFDFYTLLPEMEVVVPDEEVAPAAPPTTHPRAAASKPAATHEPARPAATASTATTATKTPPAETYLLQVGSFRSGEQAERFRAELALLGLQTSIQKVTIDNKDTYHRVRVGPFHDTGSLNSARSRLAKQGIESRVIKIKQ